jgi:hypothetical protein
MVDAITGTSTGWTPPIDDTDDDVRRRAAAASTTKVATAPPEAPDGPGLSGALLVRAAQAQAQAQAPQPQTAAPRMLLAAAVEAPTTATSDQDTAVQTRMNAFFDSAVPTYRIPPAGQGQAGEFVAVATPFQMTSKTTERRGETDQATLRYIAHEKSVTAKAPELKAIAGSIGISAGSVDAIIAGRGTPAQVQKLTQALLDKNKLPPPAKAGEATAVRVRRMMSDYGIGFDCAGFTQQAFLAAHGVTRAQAGLKPRILDEDLSGLSSERFQKVAPEEAHAGDILALGPRDPNSTEVGHRVLVFDCHEATKEELSRYCQSPAAAALAKGHVSVLVVDSSFGSGAQPAKGGVLRQTWLYDSVSKKWGMVIPASRNDDQDDPEHVNVRDQPLDGSHRLLGIHHYRGAR